jgi:hypothetical protein
MILGCSPRALLSSKFGDEHTIIYAGEGEIISLFYFSKKSKLG